MAEESDDADWEYEYHETETEDFFVTIDLSSFSTHIRPPKAGQETKNTPTPAAKVPVPEFAASRSELASQVDGNDSIQILGLDSGNPIVSYKSQLYSCKWTTTLGTDILLAPPQASGASGTALRSLPGVDVVAATRIKLMASPTVAKPRILSNTIDDSHATSPRASQIDPALDANDSISRPAGSHSSVNAFSGPIKAVELPLGKNPSLARQKQGAFLGQLIALKQAQGETDKVPVIVAASRQRKGEPDSDDEEEDDSDRESVGEGGSGETVGLSGSPRVSKQSTTRGSRGSTLSQEVRYQGGQDQPAIGRTPGRWVDLDPNISLENSAADTNVEQVERGGSVGREGAAMGIIAAESLGSNTGEMEGIARTFESGVDQRAHDMLQTSVPSSEDVAVNGELGTRTSQGDDRAVRESDIEMEDA